MKGQYNGICNRTACSNTSAVFYNYSTKMYYCPSCAKLINDANHVDAMRLYGHDVCLPISPEGVEVGGSGPVEDIHELARKTENAAVEDETKD